MRPDRLWTALALAAVLAVAAAGSASLVPRYVKIGTLYRIQRGDAAYGFDAAWRVELLWTRNPSGAWEKVRNPPESRLEPLRRALLSEMGRDALREIPEEGKSERDSLKSLGYL